MKQNNGHLSTSQLIAQAKSSTSGQAKCSSHNHGVMTRSFSESIDGIVVVTNIHTYASGNKEGAFFTEDVR